MSNEPEGDPVERAVIAARTAVSILADVAVELQQRTAKSEQDWLEYVHEQNERYEDEIARMKRLIHKFLDSVQRPVGSFKYEVPQSNETGRAIAALFEAVGRNP